MDLSALASQPLSAALSNIFLALFTIFLTALLRVAAGYLRAHTTVDQRVLINSIAQTAVTTAEQLAIAANINPDAKKQYAEGLVAHELSTVGISLTPTQIDTAIESAVYQTFNYGRPTPIVSAPPDAAKAA